MSKAFSPLTLGVGFTALLALVPGLGIGSNQGAGKGAGGVAKTLAEAKRLQNAEAIEALLDRCLDERPQGGPPGVDVTILTLPDPQRTHMAFWFDLRLNAVQRAFKENGYLPRAFYLPWEARPKDDGAAEILSTFPEANPGLIWFARARLATDSPGGSAPYHALFIVGESQSLGLNREAMRRALGLAQKAKGAGDGPPLAIPRTVPISSPTTTPITIPVTIPITIIGPQFSGSLSSLGAALEAHFRVPSAAPIRIQGTTTLDAQAAATLRATTGGVPSPRLWISNWICNLSGSSKEQLLTWYRREAGWPKGPSKVALFTESNTAYSQVSGPTTRKGANPEGPTQILFPMGLSRLRAERRAMEHTLAKDGGAMVLVLPSTLLGPSEDDALRVLDTVPQYSADTIRNTEMTLAATVLSLARRGYTHIGISASDPQDLIFLAERIRAYHPSCTLFTTSGNHALFAHPNFSAGMDGMILLGGYPLTDSMRAISLLKGELESPVRFTSEGEYAAYYATLLALDPSRAKDPDQRLWGKQGFVSVVKSGSIWPLRHGGVELPSASGGSPWDLKVEDDFLGVAKGSSDLLQYVHSRLQQLSLLLLLLGGACGWVFLKPLFEVAGAPPQEPHLRPYRNLAAGALLAMAVVSLLGAGYLLPHAKLNGAPWQDRFLWVSLVAWTGLLVQTGRALAGRWAWYRTLPLLALALSPAFLVAWWGWTHFLVFMPGYLRFTSPGRGVSLLPTMLILAIGLALLLKVWFDMGRQEHPAFWPRPVGLTAANHAPLGRFRSVHAQLWIGLLVGVLLLFHGIVPGGILRPLMEVPEVTTVVVGAGGCIFVASCFFFWQLFEGWRILKLVLDDLNFSPYRAAFAEAGKLMNWNAMQALGRGLKTHRSSEWGRQLLGAQQGWMAGVDPQYGRDLAELDRVVAAVPQGRKAMNNLARWKLRFKVASLMSACGEALQSASEKLPAEAAAHQQEVHLFFALRAITFIRQAFLVARSLLIGSLGTMLMLVLAVAAFDFQPKAEVLTILGAALLAMAGWAALSIIQMERDPLLCLMQEGAVAGEVQFSMGLLENGVRYVLVPLLLLFGALHPSFGSMLVQAFNPLLHLLK